MDRFLVFYQSDQYVSRRAKLELLTGFEGRISVLFVVRLYSFLLWFANRFKEYLVVTSSAGALIRGVANGNARAGTASARRVGNLCLVRFRCFLFFYGLRPACALLPRYN